jgi:hypothetical protein
MSELDIGKLADELVERMKPKTMQVQDYSFSGYASPMSGVGGNPYDLASLQPEPDSFLGFLGGFGGIVAKLLGLTAEDKNGTEVPIFKTNFRMQDRNLPAFKNSMLGNNRRVMGSASSGSSPLAVNALTRLFDDDSVFGRWLNETDSNGKPVLPDADRAFFGGIQNVVRNENVAPMLIPLMNMLTGQDRGLSANVMNASSFQMVGGLGSTHGFGYNTDTGRNKFNLDSVFGDDYTRQRMAAARMGSQAAYDLTWDGLVRRDSVHGASETLVGQIVSDAIRTGALDKDLGRFTVGRYDETGGSREDVEFHRLGAEERLKAAERTGDRESAKKLREEIRRYDDRLSYFGAMDDKADIQDKKVDAEARLRTAVQEGNYDEERRIREEITGYDDRLAYLENSGSREDRGRAADRTSDMIRRQGELRRKRFDAEKRLSAAEEAGNEDEAARIQDELSGYEQQLDTLSPEIDNRLSDVGRSVNGLDTRDVNDRIATLIRHQDDLRGAKLELGQSRRDAESRGDADAVKEIDDQIREYDVKINALSAQIKSLGDRVRDAAEPLVDAVTGVVDSLKDFYGSEEESKKALDQMTGGEGSKNAEAARTLTRQLDEIKMTGLMAGFDPSQTGAFMNEMMARSFNDERSALAAGSNAQSQFGMALTGMSLRAASGIADTRERRLYMNAAREYASSADKSRGKNLSFSLEAMRREGMVGGEEYASLNDMLTSGRKGTINQAERRIAQLLGGGSVEEGMRMLNDPSSMARLAGSLNLEDAKTASERFDLMHRNELDVVGRAAARRADVRRGKSALVDAGMKRRDVDNSVELARSGALRSELDSIIQTEGIDSETLKSANAALAQYDIDYKDGLDRYNGDKAKAAEYANQRFRANYETMLPPEVRERIRNAEHDASMDTLNGLRDFRDEEGNVVDVTTTGNGNLDMYLEGVGAFGTDHRMNRSAFTKVYTQTLDTLLRNDTLRDKDGNKFDRKYLQDTKEKIDAAMAAGDRSTAFSLFAELQDKMGGPYSTTATIAGSNVRKSGIYGTDQAAQEIMSRLSDDFSDADQKEAFSKANSEYERSEATLSSLERKKRDSEAYIRFDDEYNSAKERKEAAEARANDESLSDAERAVAREEAEQADREMQAAASSRDSLAGVSANSDKNKELSAEERRASVENDVAVTSNAIDVARENRDRLKTERDAIFEQRSSDRQAYQEARSIAYSTDSSVTDEQREAAREKMRVLEAQASRTKNAIETLSEDKELARHLTGMSDDAKLILAQNRAVIMSDTATQEEKDRAQADYDRVKQEAIRESKGDMTRAFEFLQNGDMEAFRDIFKNAGVAIETFTDIIKNALVKLGVDPSELDNGKAEGTPEGGGTTEASEGQQQAEERPPAASEEAAAEDILPQAEWGRPPSPSEDVQEQLVTGNEPSVTELGSGDVVVGTPEGGGTVVSTDEAVQTSDDMAGERESNAIVSADAASGAAIGGDAAGSLVSEEELHAEEKNAIPPPDGGQAYDDVSGDIPEPWAASEHGSKESEAFKEAREAEESAAEAVVEEGSQAGKSDDLATSVGQLIPAIEKSTAAMETAADSMVTLARSGEGVLADEP